MAVTGRIHHADRNVLRQPSAATRYTPIAASGSTMPTGPLASTARPMQAYMGMAYCSLKGDREQGLGVRDWGLGIGGWGLGISDFRFSISDLLAPGP